MHPRVHYWLIDVPARIVDGVWYGYWLFIAGGAIVCIVTGALVLVLYQFGIRFGW